MLLACVIAVSCKTDATNNKTDNIFTFRKYVSQTTSGRISVVSPIKIELKNEVDSWVPNQEIKESIVSIFPAIDGRLISLNNRTLIFEPAENLQRNTEYSVTIQLGKIYPNVPDDYKTYTFKFKTIQQNFSINTSDIQSYNKEWQYLEGVLKAADEMKIEEAESILKATQNSKNLKVKWQKGLDQSTIFEFKIDSIQRFIEDSEVDISWSGKSINVDNEGESIIEIPGINNFKIVKAEVVQSPEQYLKINFSNPLKKQQNFKGLVAIEDTKNLKYIVDGNLLKVYPNSRIIGTKEISIFEGIKSVDGYKLKNSGTLNLTFEQLKPKVRFLSNGVILPNSSNLKFNFEAVNLRAVDVKIIKIFKDNVLQFLQSKNLANTRDYGLRQVGRRIAVKTIPLVKNKIKDDGKWHSYALDLSKMIKADPGAIYRIELSIKQEYSLYKCKEEEQSASFDEGEISMYYEDEIYVDTNKKYSKSEQKNFDDAEEEYWDNRYSYYNNHNYYRWEERDDPCKIAYYDNDDRIVSANILGSNLGVIVKKEEDKSYFIAVNDLLTTSPVQDATVKLYNFQQQEIAMTKSDSEGFAYIKTTNNTSFVIVSKGENTTYVRVGDGNSLSMSKYDVSGKKLQKGLKGYLYGERGIWRPGDTIHLTFILDDKENPLPKNHPIKLEFTDAQGKLVYQKVALNGANGFYSFSIPTAASSPTGNWLANVSVGGVHFCKKIKVETIKPNRLKISIDFDKEVLSTSKPIRGDLKINWLHGAPGKNLKAEVKVKFTEMDANFKGFEKYEFKDPIRSFNSEELVVFDGKVNADGIAKINKKINVQSQAPGMLRASFLTKAFEKGGDFSMDVFSKKYAPYTSFVGLQSPKPKAYDSYFTDENVTFDVATVSDDGKPIQRKNLEVKVYKIKWRWWWSSSYDDLSSYVSSEYHEPHKFFLVNTDSKGKATIKINIPDVDGGRFLIRITDPVSGHATGRTAYFYKNWWQRPSDSNSEAATMLIFSSDKESYKVGDVAKITFPSGSTGRALISLENGSKILNTSWVETQKGETTVEIPITKEMAPNIFANISLLQPHANTVNDLPIRLYGVLPILVEDPETRLEPVISMPKSLKPEKEFTVKISEKSGKRMTYTLAVVDDGLLDLTRFRTPNAWDEFYKKEALGVKTWDIYDDVIGAFSGSVDQVFAIGGDGDLAGNKSKKANRFKPVVTYLGPFVLKKGETKSHKIKMPNYIGSVRTMVVAGDIDKGAYGNVQETTPVKKPLMVLASLPRKLSPGEKVTLPVTVFAMDKKVKKATITLKLDNKIKVIGEQSKIIYFDKPDEKMLYFELEVLDNQGITEIEILASGNGEKASYKVEMDVVNPNPFTKKMLSKTIAANEMISFDFNTFGVSGTNSATIEFSTLPPMDFSKRMEYLIQYPHGCVEQTTSSVFPQLFLADIFDLTADKESKMEENIKNGIKRLGNFQLTNGGLSYWIGQSNSNDWGTSYAGHFMIESEKKGYTLPFTFMSNWLKYQQETARNWRPSYTQYSNDIAQSYRLYTLALAGYPDLASMNRLREFSSLTNNAKWRLAAAYALAGQKEAAKKLVNSASIHFVKDPYSYYSYGSVDRNRAMALETLVLIGDSEARKLSEIIAKELSSDKWMSTQSTAYSLLAMAKMLAVNGGKSMEVNYELNGEKAVVKTDKALSQRMLNVKGGLNTLSLENKIGNVIYVKLMNIGKLALGNEVSEKRNLGISVVYKDANDKIISISKLSQGTEFKAIVTITNLASDVKDVALTEIFPSGWEIINTRFSDFGSTVTASDFTDIRDDKANFYFDLNANESRSFEARLNASYLGKYYLFGVQAEAMYDNDYFVRSKGKWVEVEK